MSEKLPVPLYWQSEGTRDDGVTYHSDQCHASIDDDTKRFFHALLDEFLESFTRDGKATLEFMACDIDAHQKPKEDAK